MREHVGMRAARVAVGSIGRGTKIDRASGYVRIVDLEIDKGAKVPRSPRGTDSGQPRLRALGRVGPGLWLVGSQQRLALHAVDIAAGRVVRTDDLAGEPEETMYAVCDPLDRFDDPRPVSGPDPYAFWTGAHLRADVTPIPN